MVSVGSAGLHMKGMLLGRLSSLETSYVWIGGGDLSQNSLKLHSRASKTPELNMVNTTGSVMHECQVVRCRALENRTSYHLGSGTRRLCTIMRSAGVQDM